MKDKKLVIKPRKPKGEDGYKVFSIRVREDTVARIDQIAAETGRSRNALIGMFLDFALENCIIDRNHVNK